MLVQYNEALSDLVSEVDVNGAEKVGRDLLTHFPKHATDLAFAILQASQEKKKAALFRP